MEQGSVYARRWWIFGAIGVGTYLNVLDMSMLNVALPTITRELQTDVATVQWVALGYLLVISALLLTGGRLADVFGQRRIYLIGTIVFIVASTLAGVVGDVYQLIGLRILQGVGSALVQGVGPAILATVFPPTERGKVLGSISTTVALGGISGPVLGGIVADALGWRWIFFSRVPISLIVLVATIALLPADEGRRRDQRFDVAGAVTLFVGLSSLLMALSQGRIWGWGSAPVVALFAVAAVLAAGFVWIETTTTQPMLPLGVFRNRLFAAANASSFVTFCAITAPYFLMPFLLIEGQGLTASQAGFLLVPSMVMMSITSPFTGALSDRFGSRVLTPLGIGLIVLGLYALSRLTLESAALDVVWRSALVGLGMGTFGSPNNNAIMSALPRAQIGLAAGTMATMRNLGNVVGTAIAGTVVTNREAIHRAELAASGLVASAVEARGLASAISDALVVAAAIGVFGLAIALIRGTSPLSAAATGAGAAPTIHPARSPTTGPARGT